MIEIREFIDSKGRSPYARWFDRLHAHAAAKVAVSLIRMEQGNLSDAQSVGPGVFECRIHYGPGYRVYFGRDGDTLIILLGAGTKARHAEGHRDRQKPMARLQAAQVAGAMNSCP